MPHLTPTKPKKKKKGPRIEFGPSVVVPPINIEEIQKAIMQDRKFKDERLQRVRKRMFRRDI